MRSSFVPHVVVFRLFTIYVYLEMRRASEGRTPIIGCAHANPEQFAYARMGVGCKEDVTASPAKPPDVWVSWHSEGCLFEPGLFLSRIIIACDAFIFLSSSLPVLHP